MSGYPQKARPDEPGAVSWTDPLRRGWGAVPEARRRDLERVLTVLPGSLRQWRRLLEAGVESLRLTAGDRRRVTIVGPPNVGKSTLYNRLILGGQPRAPVGPNPGTTTEVQQGDGGVFALVDTPGAEEEGGDLLTKAVDAARRADVLIVLFDATAPPTTDGRRLLDRLTDGGKPRVIALNKMDAVGKGRREAVARAGAALGVPPETIVPISARRGEGLERLLTEVARSEPEIVAALGQALPGYRRTLAEAAIRRAASTAAAIALTPLPMIAFIPLVGVQAALVLGLARIYDVPLTLRRARELVATFGIALLGRTLFHELVKLGGPPAWLLSASVAAGTTVALGYGAAAWFERGERLAPARLEGVAGRVGQAVLARLRGRRRPPRAEVEQQVRVVLEDTLSPGDPADPIDGL